MIKILAITILFFQIAYTFVIADTWSSYYGGSGLDTINQMIEAEDYIYVVGTTSSPDGISYGGVYQKTLSGGTDCFLAKFDKSGNRIWGTYFGGPDNDYGTSICYDSYKKALIICGYTASKTGIASSFAEQNIFAGGNYDAFAAVFDLNCNLLWSTYIGGSGDDIANSICTNNDGKFVVGGKTNSSNLKTDDNVYQKSKSLGYDGFIAVYNIEDGKNEWVTYFGGNGNDNIKSVYIDSDEIYFAGSTDSDAGISKGNLHNTSYSGNIDGFYGELISKSELDWAYYYGGTEFDELVGIYEESSILYLLGTTKSQNLASHDSKYQQLSGGSDVIFSIFDNEIHENTSYLGGNKDDEAKGLYIRDGNIYITGKTLSADNIALKDSYQDTIKGNSDAFICIFDKDNNLNYSSYFGGEGDEYGNTLIGNSGNIYIAGSTTSSKGIANKNSHQQSFGGLTDGFITKYDDVNFKIVSINKTEFCGGDSIIVDFTVVGVIGNSNKFYLEISDKNESFDFPKLLGTLNSQTSGTFRTVIPLDMPTGNKYKIRIRADYQNEISEDYSEEIKINSIPQPKITGSNQICLNSESYYSVTVNATESYNWSVSGGLITEGNGTNKVKVIWNNVGTNKIQINASNSICSQVDSFLVTVNKLPDVTLTKFQNKCFNDASFALNGGLPIGGKYFIDNVEKTQFEPLIAGIGVHEIEYRYSDSITCQNSAVQFIEVFDIPSKPIITKLNDELISNYDNGNQWFLDGLKINNADQKNYKPVKSGNYSLKVTNINNCTSDFSETTYYDINQYLPILTILSEPIFKSLICENSDKSSLKISNTGNADLVLDSIIITGLDKSNFSVNTISNTIIAPNDSFSIDINFIPKASGNKSAFIEIFSDSKSASSANISLEAKKDISSFRLSDEFVDFGEVELGKTYEKDFWIINDGTIALSFVYPIVSGNFKITEIIPAIIKLGDSSKVIVQYFADNQGDFIGSSKFKDTCENSKIIDFHIAVKSIITKPVINIEAGNVDSKSGDDLIIPIIINNRKIIIDSGFTEINLVLEFNATLLHPTGNTPIGEITLGKRKIPLKINLTNDSIFDFTFKATLGDDSVTALKLSDILIPGSDFDIKEKDGLFRLLDLCKAGGTRLIKFDGEITFSVIPNPAFEYLDFSINLIENGNTNLYIVNYNGEIIKSVINSYINKGKFDTRIDISDLASGNYFIKLITPTYKKTYKFNIVK